MIRTIYEVGDEVGYPVIQSPECDRKMTVIDRQIIRYRKSGKLYFRYLCSGLLERLAEDVRTNVEMEYDNLIVIDGKEGSGKSNLAVALCHAIDPEFDLESSYIYNYGEFIQAITGNDDDHHKVFLLDEGSLVANKRESMSEDSRRFIELLETMRSRGWTLVMCIPDAHRLDVYIREHRMRYLLSAKEMKWDEVHTEVSRGYFELLFKRGDTLESFRTVAYGEFPKMDPEEKKVYEKLKKQSQRRLMDKIAGKTQKESPKFIQQTDRIKRGMLKLRDMGMTYPEIGEMFGYRADTTKEMIKEARKRLGNKEGVDDGEDA